MIAGVHNFSIDQGADDAFEVTIADYDKLTEISTPWDLTGYLIRGHMRASTRPDEPIAGVMVCAIVDVAGGKVSVSVPNAVSSAMEARRHYYDVELYTADEVTKIKFIRGTVDLTQDQTRT
jgi:hypothetical protein